MIKVEARLVKNDKAVKGVAKREVCYSRQVVELVQEALALVHISTSELVKFTFVIHVKEGKK